MYAWNFVNLIKQHDLVEIRAVGFSAENPVMHLGWKFQYTYKLTEPKVKCKFYDKCWLKTLLFKKQFYQR